MVRLVLFWEWLPLRTRGVSRPAFSFWFLRNRVLGRIPFALARTEATEEAGDAAVEEVEGADDVTEVIDEPAPATASRDVRRNVPPNPQGSSEERSPVLNKYPDMPHRQKIKKKGGREGRRDAGMGWGEGGVGGGGKGEGGCVGEGEPSPLNPVPPRPRPPLSTYPPLRVRLEENTREKQKEMKKLPKKKRGKKSKITPPQRPPA